MRLYEIDRHLEQFEACLAEGEGELNEEMEAQWQRLISIREDKWRAYVSIIKQLEAEEEAFKAEAERLKKASQARSRGVSWMKDQLLLSLDQAELIEVKTEIGKIQIMSAPNRPVLLKVQAMSLPPEYRRITISADLAHIGKELKAGNQTVAEFAELGPASRYVRIF